VLARIRTPEFFARVALAALGALTLIVLTGAAVRLTGSGLGCPDWPKCYGRTLPPLDTHAAIEFSNRMLSGLVGLLTVATFVLALLRRPFRRDLAILAALLPLGVAAQAALGGAVVRRALAPGYVMAHFGLSMLVLIAAAALYWRARHGREARAVLVDRPLVWSVRALLALGALTIFVGTAATAAGPHAGGKPGQRIHRLTFEGSDTMNYVIHRHAGLATLLGLASVGVWVLARQRRADADLRRALTTLIALLAVQGVLGGAQYALKLPAEMVWTHVVTASLTWLALLWAVAAAGRLAPRRAAEALRPQAASGR
jgi:cytochrome c oxidase assembly protein subunit 15